MFGTFQYDNKKYEVQVGLSDSDDGKTTVTLLPENIGTIEYTNTLNDIVHEGSIEYTDTDQRIDKFLGNTYVYCVVIFTELKDKSDGNINDTLNGNMMPISFFVNNIGIEENTPGRIKYKLILSSTTWMNCIRNVNYSNYEKGKENVFDIVKNILTQSEFKIDSKSFDSVGTTSGLNYITSGNDNVITSLRYLLNKMYFSNEYGFDTGIKGIVYDEYTKLIRVVDAERKNEFQQSFSVSVNQTKNDINPITNQKVNLAFNVKQNKSDLMDSMVSNILYKYSLDTNKFENEEILSESILRYYSGNNDNSRVKTLPNNGTYKKYQTVWNNNINIYWDQMKNLTQYGSLILNAPGKVGLIPGWFVNVNIPIKDEFVMDQDKKHQQKVKNAYQAMCGTWIASSVTNFINPQKKIFRQNISLMRNDKLISVD